MTDRELLELAAKAVGIVGQYVETFPGIGGIVGTGINAADCQWNPLTDDGAALRLAVRLNIHILRFWSMTTARPLFADWACDERDDGDADAATRRAIVRAAAEIGRKMG